MHTVKMVFCIFVLWYIGTAWQDDIKLDMNWIWILWIWTEWNGFDWL